MTKDDTRQGLDTGASATMSETVTVLQADVDRAADFLESWEPGPEMTVVKLACEFAAHRIAHPSSEEVRLRDAASALLAVFDEQKRRTQLGACLIMEAAANAPFKSEAELRREGNAAIDALRALLGGGANG